MKLYMMFNFKYIADEINAHMAMHVHNLMIKTEEFESIENRDPSMHKLLIDRGYFYALGVFIQEMGAFPIERSDLVLKPFMQEFVVNFSKTLKHPKYKILPEEHKKEIDSKINHIVGLIANSRNKLFDKKYTLKVINNEEILIIGQEIIKFSYDLYTIYLKINKH